jgi:ribosomal protein S18 acetylase RimI-like enzyme
VDRTVTIRPWVDKDIEYIVRSISREQWGHTRGDVERCWHWEPNGCFLAEEESERVGHVSTITYGRLGWIGLLIVNPERRGRLIGTALMERAVDYLRRSGVETIRLEAVERAVSLYRRLGFRTEFESLRYRGRMQIARRKSFEGEVSPAQPKDLGRLSFLDSGCFGSNRNRVLKTFIDGNPQHCLVARGNGLLGYIMYRRTQNGYWMGPWVCTDVAASEKLLNGSLSSIGDPNVELRFGFPSPNEEMKKLMRRGNFEFSGRSIRMVLGEDEYNGRPQHIFGIAGPEKG